jgi:beta-glucosidase-like glycosyl hydrolase
MRAGADIVLVQEASDVNRVIGALTPLARRGGLDDAVKRVIAFRRQLGFVLLP